MLILTSASLSAGFINVKNFSFESNVLPSLDPNEVHVYAIDDWQINLLPATYAPNGGTVRFFTNWLSPTATDGLNVAFLNNNSYILQVLDRTFQQGDNFELKVDIGWRTDVPDIFKPQYSVQLLAGGSVLASSGDQAILVHGGWATATASYSYDLAHSGLVGEQLKLKLEKLNSGQVNFDNVRLQATAVPEPNSAIWFVFMSMVRLSCRRNR
jgi:hypothetical protein